ncbi:hypothetical protein H632_c3305p0, partial [Helicosporidium sp. ATCC 50920]
LRALECVLDTVSGFLERLTAELEAGAHPALDALTDKITTSNLERVRRIKNRMVRLTKRVETLREVLEKFLDDDSDMKSMYLTAREEERALALEKQEALRMQALAAAAGGAPSVAPPGAAAAFGGSPRMAAFLGEDPPYSPRSLKTYSSSSSSSSLEDEEIAEVEMLLEPYFMQLDNTFNKLQTLCEYIDDTEDYINIELDSHRNELIRLDLVLTALTASVALITAVTSLFAMNLELRPGVPGQGPYWEFVVVSVTCCVTAVVIFASVMAYCRYKRLM